MGILSNFTNHPAPAPPAGTSVAVRWNGHNFNQILEFAPTAILTETGAIYLPASIREDTPWLDLGGYLVTTSTGHYPVTPDQGVAGIVRAEAS